MAGQQPDTALSPTRLSAPSPAYAPARHATRPPVRTGVPARPPASPRPRSHRGPVRPGAVAYPHRRSPRQLSRFAQILAEVLAGERPVGQVRPLLGRRAYELLRRRAGGYACARSPRVRKAVLSTPSPDAVEISAVVDCGDRCRVFALRVAYAQHAWLCTHIETDLCRAAVH
ncbi:Rv3235 family protein [Streptomonospora wellingtoniae]|uniref:Rv3235 family protein n=1 Tax=Streptomonospora wellingtoniae TaxID=3075544 RepID=A0ABU2KTS3_9ACTN|nr:Rv3235 family protein [Streptomonospora sp. DSM 45055]MDT0302686.1 Rv3235 family protein [Streptomonospora sp. DSM 45055]